jgi:hypothetical protein
MTLAQAAGGARLRWGGGFCPPKPGSGTVGCPLELPELGLAARASAVHPCPVEVEALTTVARFVSQPLSFVLLVSRCVDAVKGAAMTLGPAGHDATRSARK